MRNFVSITTFMLVSLFCQMTTTVNAQVLERDSLALVALYNSTDGANWTNNTNWLSEQPVSTWYGIRVSDSNVTSIDLGRNNLSGVIPTEMGDLDSLSFLYMRVNNLSGSIPEEISNLTKLIYLNISFNQLSGTIPLKIGNMINLKQLRIDGNQLTGTIPDTLSNLINLRELYLAKNQLTGTMPNTLGNLTNLKYFSLEDNQLSGAIPESFGNLANLQILNLSNNQISGVIPNLLGNLNNLIILSLYSNQLTGSIPDSIGNLTNLTYLSLGENQLSGAIPGAIGNLTNLTNLSLNDNQFTGTIPTSIGNLTNLNYLYLYRNQLTGTIPDTIGNLTNLIYLYLLNNQLTGAIPIEITNLNNLIIFYIQNNQLVDLPDLNPLTNLGSLVVQNNRFTFEDIEPNIGISTFTYTPQDSVVIRSDTTINEGDNLNISVSVGGTANLYQWMKDGVDISGAVDSAYVITDALAADSGSYICKITNTIATELTLFSRPVHVIIENPNAIEDFSDIMPKEYNLYQNYPNPFNPLTNIKFALPKAGLVKIEVFNILGESVAALLNAKKAAGYHIITFNANQFPSGLYFYTIKADNFHQVKKMILIR